MVLDGRVIADAVRYDVSECGKPLIQFDWYFLTRRGRDGHQRQKHRSPRVTTKAERSWEKPEKGLLYKIQRELVLPIPHIGLLTSRTSRQCVAIVLSPASVVRLCYSSHRSGMQQGQLLFTVCPWSYVPPDLETSRDLEKLRHRKS